MTVRVVRPSGGMVTGFEALKWVDYSLVYNQTRSAEGFGGGRVPTVARSAPPRTAARRSCARITNLTGGANVI